MTEGILDRRRSMPAGAVRQSSGKIHTRALSLRYALICSRAHLSVSMRAYSKRWHTVQSAVRDICAVPAQAAMRLLLLLAPAAAIAGEAVVDVGGRVRQTVGGRAIGAVGALRAHKPSRLNAALFFCTAAVVLMLVSFYGVGLEVVLDGQSLGYVTSTEQFESAVSGASASASRILGRPYVIFPNAEYHFSVVNRNLIFDQRQVEAKLLAQIGEIQNLYVLRVDGQDIGASADYSAIRGALDRVLSAGPRASASDQVTFYQDVRIEQKLTSTTLAMSNAEMLDLLQSNVRDAETYETVAGDTRESVAQRFGISVKTLAELNPGLDQSELAVGTALVVNEEIPFLSVCQTGTVTYSEQIEFPVETIQDDTMFEGDTRIVTEGVQGQTLVSAQVELLNGKEVGRTVLSRQTVSEPVTQVEAKGTRVRYAVGSFIRPYNGMLTSNYGNRYVFGKLDFHPGIDLAGPNGSPIVASDGGKVVFAGQQSGYGNIVIIDHQNGYKTAYAHCSKLLVSVGQMVAQGELIAKVGSTGRSTGPHVHFEIRKDTTRINPLKLLTN